MILINEKCITQTHTQKKKMNDQKFFESDVIQRTEREERLKERERERAWLKRIVKDHGLLVIQCLLSHRQKKLGEYYLSRKTADYARDVTHL